MKKILLLTFAVMASLYALSQTTSHKQTVQYLINRSDTLNPDTSRYWAYVPPDYATRPTKKFTLVIFLHGKGERGDTTPQMDSILNLENTPPWYAERQEFPFIMLSPQLKKKYSGWYRSYVNNLVKAAKKKYRVDSTNIYLIGLSLGGGGVWDASTYPGIAEHFKGIVPVCGSSSYPDRACNLVNNKTRVWAFHGTADDVVNVSVTQTMIDSINRCPSITIPPKLTLYNGVKHDSWTNAFKTDNSLHLPNVYQWIMQTSSTTPVSNAGADKIITLPVNSINLTGLPTDDGSIAGYQWTKLSGGQATLTNANTATLSVSNLVAGSYTFRLIVTDDTGWKSLPDDVVIEVKTSTNALPVVNAGADVAVLSGKSATLTGTASDTDGTIASYVWTKVSGGQATLTNATTATLTVSGMLPGGYVFRLTATDNAGGSSYDDVNVYMNNPPVANAGPNIDITLPVSSAQFIGSGTDTDGSIVSYAWSQYEGEPATMSGTTTATLTASNLKVGKYGFRLVVTDNKTDTGRDYVTIYVNAPPEVNAGTNQTIMLPANSLTLAGSATDVNGTITSVNWTKVAGGSATLANANTTTLSVSDLVQDTYTFRLTATDNLGATSSDDVVVTVLPPTQLPVVNAGADKNANVGSNLDITGSATDPDGTIVSYAWSKISGGTATLTNANTTKVTVSGMEAGSYVFRLTATDNAGATNFDDVNVFVNIPPVADAGPDMTITLPQNSAQLFGSGSDEDGTISTYTWLQHEGPSTATMSGANTPTLTVSNLMAGKYMFKLMVRDNKMAASNNNYMTLIVNRPPIANAGADTTITLPANSLTIKGSGTDPDGTVIRTYTWAKTAGGAATLSANKEFLTISNLAQGSYTFSLVVTDTYFAASAPDEVIVTVSASGNISASGGGWQKESSAPDCDNCTIRIYDANGKLFYDGSYSNENHNAITREHKFYYYNLFRNNRKIEAGKVLRVE